MAPSRRRPDPLPQPLPSLSLHDHWLSPSPSSVAGHRRCCRGHLLLHQRPPRPSLSSSPPSPSHHRLIAAATNSRLPFADLPSLHCGSTPTSFSSFSDLGADLPRPLFFRSGKLDRPCFFYRLRLLSLSAAMASSSSASVTEPRRRRLLRPP